MFKATALLSDGTGAGQEKVTWGGGASRGHSTRRGVCGPQRADAQGGSSGLGRRDFPAGPSAWSLVPATGSGTCSLPAMDPHVHILEVEPWDREAWESELSKPRGGQLGVAHLRCPPARPLTCRAAGPSRNPAVVPTAVRATTCAEWPPLGSQDIPRIPFCLPGCEGPGAPEAPSADSDSPSPPELPTRAACQRPEDELPLDGTSESSQYPVRDSPRNPLGN